MLDAIGAGLTPCVGDRDWADIWHESPEFKETIEEIQQIKAGGLKKPVEEKSSITRYPMPFLFQMKTVAARSFHWGQGVVYWAGTLQIHCRDMDKVPTIYQPGH